MASHRRNWGSRRYERGHPPPCGAEALVARTKEGAMERSIDMQSHCEQLPPEHPWLEALPRQEAASPEAESMHTRLGMPWWPLEGRQLYG